MNYELSTQLVKYINNLIALELFIKTDYEKHQIYAGLYGFSNIIIHSICPNSNAKKVHDTCKTWSSTAVKECNMENDELIH